MKERIAGLFVLALSVATSASTQGLQWISRGEGLPSLQVHELVQGLDDRMWMATPAGLASFDGARVSVLTKKDGLTTQGIRSLEVDAGGLLLVGTDAGVDVVADGRAEPLVPDWRWGFVEAMSFDEAGSLWIGSSAGLLRWREQTGISEFPDSQVADTLITDVVSGAGGVWVATSRGLARVEEGQIEAVNDPVLKALGTIRRLAADNDGLWVGGDGGLAFLPDTGAARLIVESPGSSGVSAILRTGDELWVGLSSQLLLYLRSGGEWALADIVLDETLVNHLLEDSFGNVWLATDSHGVGRSSVLRSYLTTAPLPCRTQVYSISPHTDGFLVGGESCSWIAGPNLEIREALEGLSRIKVWDLKLVDDAEIWAATETGLRVGGAGRDFELEDYDLEILGSPGRVLLNDVAGVWVGTVSGLVRVEDDVAREVTDQNGSGLGYVYTLVRGQGEDDRESVYIGTIGNGAFRWTPRDGVRRFLDGTHSGNVYAIATRADGALALAQDDKILVVEKGEVRQLEPASNDAVAGWSVAFGANDTLWIGSNRGLVRYDLVSGENGRVISSMGLAGDEFTTSRSLYRTMDGLMILGTDGGLSSAMPGVVDQTLPRPKPLLAHFDWRGVTPRQGRQKTEVTQGRWSLNVGVAGPWLIDASSLSFHYRLRGFDGEWSSLRPLSEPDFGFTALPPGTYDLEAQVHSPLVGWGDVTTLSSFTVVPVWWNRPLTRIAAGKLLFLLAGVFWWRRNRSLMKRASDLEQLVAQRTKELDRLASRDPLTGLPNRRSFSREGERRIARASRHGESFGLVIIDLDNFKRVNDKYGHLAGDAALVEIARVLIPQVRGADTLVRYGGDELALLCDCTSSEEVLEAANRFRVTLARDTNFAPEDVQLTASFGVATWEAGLDLESLFRRADLAVYEEKKVKNCVEAWRPSLEEPGAGGVR